MERVEGHKRHIAVHPDRCYFRRLPRAQGLETLDVKGEAADFFYSFTALDTLTHGN
jgi:hypothetical protein